MNRRAPHRTAYWDGLALPSSLGPPEAASGYGDLRSILPKALEPIRRQCGVAHRGHDRAVTKVVLDGPRVVPIIGELEAAGVPQHVRKGKLAATPARATMRW